MDFLFTYLLPFLVLLTVLVFVHELGHYYVARRNGVRIDVFSVGFGPEIFGHTDAYGTRWKFSAIPLGGYVKMFGEGEHTGGGASEQPLTEEEKRVSFNHKTLGQRAAIVFAGPAANFLFAIAVLAAVFMIVGQPYTPAEVGNVRAGSAAAAAGLEPGDKFVEIDGTIIQRFEDVQQIVRLSAGERLTLVIERNQKLLTLYATPKTSELTDRSGNVHKIGLLGVSRQGVAYVKHGPFKAVWQAMREGIQLTLGTFKAIGQMIDGTRSPKELGGPVRIGQMSGDFAKSGFIPYIWFMALLSINLGLINLFPIPMLDGGHLMFYAIEAITRRPVNEQFQEYSIRIGLALILGFMIFVTFNDIKSLFNV
ncbi:MAG: RIP metalloprotease RseP [Alphaproteobacteria bacterium]